LYKFCCIKKIINKEMPVLIHPEESIFTPLFFQFAKLT